MAESVGEAYVRIFARTSFMSRELRKEMRQAGAEAGRDFSRELERVSAARVAQTRRRIADALVTGQFDGLRREFGGTARAIEAARVALDQFIATGIRGNDATDMRARIDQWEAEQEAITETTRRMDGVAARVRIINGLHTRGLEINRQVNVERREAAVRERYLMGLEQEHALAIDRQMERQRAAAARHIEEQQRATQQHHRYLLGLEQQQAIAMNRIFDEQDRRPLFERFDNDGIERRLNRLSLAMRGASRRGGALGATLLFLPRLTLGFGRVITRLLGPLGEMGDGLLKASATASGLSRVALIGSGILAKLAGPLIGLLAGVVLLAKGLGILAVGLNLLLGIVVTVAGALQTALVGGLLPIVGLAPVVVASIGLIITAFSDLSDKQKGLLASSKTVGREIARIARNEIATPWLEAIDSIMRSSRMQDIVLPVIESMSRAIGGLGEVFQRAFDSPAMAHFLREFGEHMPNTIRLLGTGIANLGVALLGFFAPIMPFVERLAGKFEEMATNFLDWVGMAENQNKISDYMDRAWKAADSLGQVLADVFLAIQNIFNIGADNGTEQGFLDRLVTKAQEFRDWTEDPANEKKIKKWFTDAEAFAKKLWDTLVLVKDIIDDLDTEGARQDFDNFTDALVSTAEALKDIAGWLDTISRGYDKFSAFADNLEAFFGGKWGELGPPRKSTPERPQDSATENKNFQVPSGTLPLSGVDQKIDIAPVLADLVVQFNRWKPAITAALAAIPGTIVAPFRLAWNLLTGNSIVPDMVTDVQRWFTSLPGRVTGALASIGTVVTAPFRIAWNLLTGMVSAMIVSVVSFFAGMPTRIGLALAGLGVLLSGIISRAGTAAQTAASTAVGLVVSAWSGITGRIRDALSGVVDAVSDPFNRALDAAKDIWQKIKDLISNISGGAGTINRNLSSLPKGLPQTAMGGIFDRPQVRLFGEAGAEAVVPLKRPLGQVDPSVRDLAAYAQGKGGRGMVVEAGAIQIVSPHNPWTIANQVVDHLAVLAT